MSILDELKNSSDIKNLSMKNLEILAQELRDLIISTTANNGGHLSSNLGIVDTTLALYHTFDFPNDKLIFDVGHQCYAHKILSGRKDEFNTIRTYGGLSGFPDTAESEYDAFTTGHAGTSISAGLGICSARDTAGENYFVIDVVGDGSLTNGLNLEAITASNIKPKNLIVILNDNGMSISKNRNGLYGLISKSTTKRGYIKSKNLFKNVFGNSFITKFFRKVRGLIKRILNGVNYFEKFGFKYVGVCDGNDLKELCKIFERVKIASEQKAILLHVKTTKGKGLKQAEEHADRYHGVGKNHEVSDGDFSGALGDILVEKINEDKRIVTVTAAMKDGTGLYKVEKTHPENFYDVGIAEEYAVTFGAGLAKGGLKPIIAIYSTFLQRAYDQILHDVCLQNLPVIFCIDRAGLVGEDGKTHQGTFDLSYLSHMPNLTVLAPNNRFELKDALDYALQLSSPVAIRYAKSGKNFDDNNLIPISESGWTTVKTGTDGAIIAVGNKMLEIAKESARICKKDYAVISARVVKPLNEDFLKELNLPTIITMEENSVIGGFGALVSSYFAKSAKRVKVINLGVKDEFIAHGSRELQLKENGLSVDNLVNIIDKGE